MGYYYTTLPETAVPPKSWASPKTHTPGLRVSERGLRFSIPEVGRWASRDPIKDPGFQIFMPVTQMPVSILMQPHSLMLYANVENDPLNKLDALGLIILDIPASWTQCQFVRAILSAYASSADLLLLNLWFYGGGQDVELTNFGLFDSSGTAQNSALSLIRGQQTAARNAASGLGCNTSVSMPVIPITTMSSSSSTPMISQWSLTTQYSIVVSKSCDKSGCCKSLNAVVNWRLTASDRTDFNDGINPETGAPYDFGIPGFRITDRLVNACNAYMNWGGKDFNISAHTQGQESWSGSCAP